MRRRLTIVVVSLLMTLASNAQQYTGTTGLLHTPTAEMDSAGDVRLGGQYLPKEMIPGRGQIGYNTSTWYMSITPFSWIEIGYAILLEKGTHGDGTKDIHWCHKDRFFSVKIRPIEEGEWWPAIAIGCNDITSIKKGNTFKRKSGSTDGGVQLFQNYYASATKHFDVGAGTLGATLSYRWWKNDFNKKWNGVTAGVTFQPDFYDKLRVIGEYDGDGVNVGADCRVFKFLLLQAGLYDCKHFTGGACFIINLF